MLSTIPGSTEGIFLGWTRPKQQLTLAIRHQKTIRVVIGEKPACDVSIVVNYCFPQATNYREEPDSLAEPVYIWVGGSHFHLCCLVASVVQTALPCVHMNISQIGVPLGWRQPIRLGAAQK